MNKANECTCPSGDGSLVHPCPAHPAVEQAGANVGHGHVFPRADGVKMRCGGPGLCSECTADASRARAALAQSSPMRCLACGGYHGNSGLPCPNMRVTAQAQHSPAPELERPEVVARVVHSNPVVLGQCGPLNANDELMTVAQHAASVARWAEMFNRVEQQRDAALVEVERLRESKGDPVGSLEKCMKVMYERDEHAKRLEAAMARVAELESKLAELEKQEPVALANRGNQCFWVKWTEAAAGLYGPGIKLYAAPVAQAQQLNGLDKQCRDDVARALGLRPNQERGFAWSYLLASIKSCVKASGDSAQAQHSVPIAPELKRALGLVVAALEADGDRPTSKYALSELKKVLAAAHVCHLSRNALTDAQMRRLYDSSTETENERLGFAAFARLIRRAEAVHQIAAAPGKEVGHE